MDTFIKNCKKNNIKITPQRIAIYQEISNNFSHPQAIDIYKSLIKKMPNVSYDTVNRSLMLFVDCKLIKIIERNNGARRFDPVVKNHSHFHCVKCEKIIDLEEINLKVKKYKKIAKINKVSIFLEGICNKCAN